MIRSILFLAAFALSEPVVAAQVGKFTSARLVAQSLHPRPGSAILVGFEMVPKPGWHTYWHNPGDSGIAPKVTWQAPKGLKFGTLYHPAPTLGRVEGVTSFVHSGRHFLLVPVQIPGNVRPGARIPVRARLTWGSCSEIACVPEQADLALNLTAGNGEPSADLRKLAAAKAKLPKRAPMSRYSLGDSTIRLILPARLGLSGATVRFFPDGGDYYDAGSVSARSTKKGLELFARRRSTPPATISGVVTDGRRAYRISFHR